MAFLEGDAEEIGFPDNAFDVVLSTFGSMFAPNHEKARRAHTGVPPWREIGMAKLEADGIRRSLFLVPLGNWFPLHKGRNLRVFGVRKIICDSFSETPSPWRSSPSTSSSAIVHRPIGSKYFRPHSVQL